MTLEDTINLMLEEVGQNTIEVLNQGSYYEKMEEYLRLEEKMVTEKDYSEMQYFLRLAQELGETRCHAAQITGMETMARLYQLLSGEDKKALFKYCDAEFDSL